jgi:hypothetical protein
MANIRTDEKYIGGMTLHNLGHKPVTVYSNAERLKVMKDRGLQECVYHVDGDKHASRFDIGMPPGVDARPFCMLNEEEQAARTAEWWGSDKP